MKRLELGLSLFTHYPITHLGVIKSKFHYDYIWEKHKELMFGREHWKHITEDLEMKIQNHRY